MKMMYFRQFHLKSYGSRKNIFYVYALFGAPAPISAPQCHFLHTCAQAHPKFSVWDVRDPVKIYENDLNFSWIFRCRIDIISSILFACKFYSTLSKLTLNVTLESKHIQDSCSRRHGVQRRMISVVNVFVFLLLYVTYSARCGGYVCLQRLEIFSEMSDAHETTICSFTGITHISEKISRCC